MYVSVTPWKVQLEKMDEFVRYATDVAVPALQETSAGYKGGYALRSGTELLSINFYETEAQVTAAPTNEKLLAVVKQMASLGEPDLANRKTYEVVGIAPLTDT